MIRFLNKYQYHIFLFTTGIFLLGIFLGFGGYFFSPGSGGDAIVEVNGEKVPLRIFYSHYNRAINDVKPGTTLDENARKQKRNEVVRDLVQGVVFNDEAKRYGIEVPDQQVRMSLAAAPVFQENGKFSPALYMKALQYEFKMTPADFEEEQRRSLAFFKLRWLIQSCIKVTDKETEMALAATPSNLRPKDAKALEDFRTKLWQDKVTWAFNQWFTRLGQNLKVKEHFDLLEGENAKAGQ